MSKVNLKENIWIEGFDSVESQYIRSTDICIDLGNFSILYEGKTSEIPEDVAKECVEIKGMYPTKTLYKDYIDYTKGQHTNSYKPLYFAIESIQSACPEEFCIIYKID